MVFGCFKILVTSRLNFVSSFKNSTRFLEKDKVFMNIYFFSTLSCCKVRSFYIIEYLLHFKSTLLIDFNVHVSYRIV